MSTQSEYLQALFERYVVSCEQRHRELMDKLDELQETLDESIAKLQNINRTE